jgi:hypothetical protein
MQRYLALPIGNCDVTNDRSFFGVFMPRRFNPPLEGETFDVYIHSMQERFPERVDESIGAFVELCEQLQEADLCMYNDETFACISGSYEPPTQWFSTVVVGFLIWMGVKEFCRLILLAWTIVQGHAPRCFVPLLARCLWYRFWLVVEFHSSKK